MSDLTYKVLHRVENPFVQLEVREYSSPYLVKPRFAVWIQEANPESKEVTVDQPTERAARKHLTRLQTEYQLKRRV